MRKLTSLLVGAAAVLTSTVALAAPEKLLLTEIVVGPSPAEYIAIHNPGSTAIDLTHYFLADFVTYYQISTATMPTVDTTDFLAQFPSGSSIAAGATQYISVGGAECFKSACGTVGAFTGFGLYPTYEVAFADATKTSASVPDMLAPFTTAIGNTHSLTNGGEPIILFYWDGVTALVTDIDYVGYGTCTGVNKTGVSTYLPDTANNTTTLHAPLSSGGTTVNTCRTDMAETGQTMTGGNGVFGHDETSEPNNTNWTACASVTPGGTGGSGGSAGSAGSAGSSTGGAAGSSTGGAAGTATGGAAGTATGGAAGTATGGAAGTATGGAAGTATGGAAGTATGGAAGEATGGAAGTATGGAAGEATGGAAGTATGGAAGEATGGAAGTATGGTAGAATGGNAGAATGGTAGAATGGAAGAAKGGAAGTATGGAAGKGGSGGSPDGGVSGKAGSSNPPAAADSTDDSGCGCRVAGNESDASGFTALLLGIAAAAGLARRRRRS